MTHKRPILIVGGGIGGLAAALALARIGRPSLVLEQRQDHTEEGAGIQIGPNGVHALRALGLAEAVEALSETPREIVLVAAVHGRCLTRLPLVPRMQARFGAPYWTLLRADLHACLLRAARDLPLISIATGVRVHDMRTTGSAVQIRDEQGRAYDGAALIGADGLWSAVARSALAAPSPTFSGRTAARALVPRAGLTGLLAETATGLWLGPRAHLVHYPVRTTMANGPHLNVVAIIDGGSPDAQWGHEISSAALADGFAGWPQQIHDLLGSAPVWRRWSLFERPPLPTWSQGPVTLLGDAAHPVLPFLAQGAVLALEDAVALAAAVRSQSADDAPAFRAYETARRARTARVAAASRRNGQIYHVSGAAALVRNMALARLPAERLLAGYDWLYGYRGPDLT